jgi:hypothetical protein
MNAQIVNRMFVEANLNLERIHAWSGKPQVEQLPWGFLKRKVPGFVTLRGGQNRFPIRAAQLDRNALSGDLLQSNVDMSRKGTADDNTFLYDKLCLSLR